MVPLPGWGGRWEHRERLGSDSSDISKKRYNLGHPRVQQTTYPCRRRSYCALLLPYPIHVHMFSLGVCRRLPSSLVFFLLSSLGRRRALHSI